MTGDDDATGRLRRLDRCLQRVEQGWKALDVDHGIQSRDLSWLQREVSRLVGDAQASGYEGLWAAARRLDRALAPLVETGAVPPPARLAQIQESIGILRLSLDDLIHEPRAAGAAIEDEGDGEVLVAASDQDWVLDLAQQFLFFGYRLTECADFAAICERAERQRPQAVVADIELVGPEDGARWQKIWTGTEPVPVLFLSGRTDFHTRLEAVRAGGVGFLPRPVKVLSLVDRLDGLTHQSDQEPFRVLIVDDQASVAGVHGAALRHAGMITQAITDPERILEVCGEFWPDLILVDLYMPGCSGFELASVIRQQDSFVGIPIVFLSSERDVTRQLQAMERGGDGFLVKPIQPEHLISAVTTRVERARAMRSMMIRDGLTGLLNHTAFKERFDLKLFNAQRSHESLCVAMLDVDRFKSVNDTYGHATGDMVLKVLARVLRQRLRKSDVIGRYGGEEFAVALPDTTLEEASRIMNDVRESFGQIVHESDGRSFTASFSCGISVYPEIAVAKDLFETADKCLYAAKEGGRNQVVTMDRMG